MTESSSVTDTSTNQSNRTRNASSASAAPSGGGDSALITEHGRTTIADAVVAKIAGIAAREVTGVHDLGGGAARAVGALRERIGQRGDHSQGVSVEVGERQAAVDLTLVADYGVSIADLAAGIRRNVISAVERMTGLDVTEVNIDVQDVYMAGEDNDDDDNDERRQSESRVQ